MTALGVVGANCPVLRHTTGGSGAQVEPIVLAGESRRTLAGHSPDTRRIRAVDNFQTSGSASSLCRVSLYQPGL
jgi:hypothetical protein